MELEINKKIEQLREYGLNNQRIVALIYLGFEEYIDNLEEDLLSASTQDLQSLERELSNTNRENLNGEEATDLLRELLKKVYGIQAQGHWNSFLLTYLDECVEEAKEAKDFLTRLQNDDPEALKQVIAAQQSPDFDAAKAAIEAASNLDES